MSIKQKGGLMEVIPITIRIEDIPRRKLKVIAGYEDKSLNGIITSAIDEKIAEWERQHGGIEIPNK